MNETTHLTDYYSGQHHLPMWPEKMNEIGKCSCTVPFAERLLIGLAQQFFAPGIIRYSGRVAADAERMERAVGTFRQ